MTSAVRQFDAILSRAAAGDASAVRILFTNCRDRLRRMIAVRMDPRLAMRLDPSDVVQEALMEASSRLPRYVQNPTVSFYPWMRALALERLVDAQRRHLAGKRSPDCEALLPEGSIWKLAQQLATSSSGPQERTVAKEERERLYQALQRLSPKDREVLVLRYLEQLSTEETAAVLGLRESAVKMRHLRALERIRDLLQNSEQDS